MDDGGKDEANLESKGHNLDTVRQQEARHRAELEKRQRLEWRAHQKKEVTDSSELAKLRDQNHKWKMRFNKLDGTYRLREKKVMQLSQELLDVKSSHQQLQEEHERQQKNHRQLSGQISELRTEKQKLILKNEKLKEAYDKLKLKIKELEDDNSRLLEQSRSSLEGYPAAEDDFVSVSHSSGPLQQHLDQLEFDKEEISAKYVQLKNEYKVIREKYNSLQLRYRQSQVKHGINVEQIHHEKLSLEKELALLHYANDDNCIDQSRHKLILLAKEDKITKLVARIEALESFIIEQDEVMHRLEERCREDSNHNLAVLQKYVLASNDHSQAALQASPSSQGDTASWNESLQDNNSTFKCMSEGSSANATDLAHINSMPSALTPAYCFSENTDVKEYQDNRELTETALSKLVSEECTQTSQSENLDQNQASTLHTQGTANAAINYTDVLSSLENQLKDKDYEIKNLEREYSKAQENSSRLKLLLEELQHKLEFQEVQHSPANEQQVIVELESKLKIAHDTIARLQAVMLPELEPMNEDQPERKLKAAHSTEASMCGALSDTVNKDAIIAELETKLNVASDTIASLQATALSDSLMEKEAVIAELESKLKITNDSLQTAVSEYGEVIAELKSKLKIASETIVSLQAAALSDSLREKGDLDIIAELESKLKIANDSLQTAASEYGDVIAELESKLKVANDKIASLQAAALSDTRAKAREDGTTTAELNSKSTDTVVEDTVITELRSKLKNAGDSIRSQKATILDDHAKITKLEEKLKAANDNVAAIQATVKEGGIEIGQLKSELENADHSILSLQAAVSEKETIIAVLESELKTASDTVMSLQAAVLSEPMKNNLVKEINEALEKVEDALSVYNHNNSLSKQLYDLMESLTQIQSTLNNGQRSTIPVMNQEKLQEYTDFQPPTQEGANFELCRIFVVVMDYDPQSLCITGRPDLELQVQSGSIILVLGLMDDNGYYTAVYQNSKGIIPANFVQEIEVRDEDLMTRLANQSIVWKSKLESHDASASKVSSRSESGLMMSSVISDQSDHVKTSDNMEDQVYRLFIGLCDYNPHLSSSKNPEFELGFKEGSLLKIFGQIMSDGYYIGELNGQRGLVPADFIADTSQYLVELSMYSPWFHMHRMSFFFPQKLPPLSHLKSKVMVALYDYQPSKDSPNAYPETELEFRAGEKIIILGHMHSDGFYTGQVEGKFGLVPSNFVKEHNL